MRILIALVCVLVAAPSLTAKSPESGPAPSQDLASLSLEDLMNVTVQTAALHAQSLQDAPGSVTVITLDEIRKYGYRTLADALAYVRGVYVTYDHTYSYPGVRGFNLPGDYSTRMLVLVNGHNMASSVDNSVSVFGQDFPLDVSLIKQIEIIRGPSSALYGSNGILATINIITRSPQEFGPTRVRAELGSFGEKKLQAASSLDLGHDARLLVSGAVVNNAGEQTLYFPELDAPETNYGRAIRMDGEKAYHLFANLTWKNWDFVALMGDRQKIQPISWGATIFNDRGTKAEDTRNFVESTYTRTFDSEKSLRWRTYYDASRFRARYPYALDEGVEDYREFDYGDWVGSQISLRSRLPRFGWLTAGVEGKVELRTMQLAVDLQPQYRKFLELDTPDKTIGFFGQQEWDITPKWKVNAGARVDLSRLRSGFISPRAALIYQPSSRTSYKFLYGRAFRNPSAYEMFFDDGGLTEIANPAARPEKATSFEFVAERKLGNRMNVLAAAYQYYLNDLLVAEYQPDGAVQYRNQGANRASGVEVEVQGRLWRSADVLGSLAIQRTIDAASRAPLPNSPGSLGKLRVSIPAAAGKLSAGAGLQYMGARQTVAGATVQAVFLPEIVLTSKRLTPNWDLQFGVRNLLNQSYSHPVGLNPIVDAMRAPARTFFVTIFWRASQETVPPSVPDGKPPALPTPSSP